MTDLPYPIWWQSLVENPSPENIVKNLNFLCESDECQTILNQLALLVTGIKISKNKYDEDVIELVLCLSSVRKSDRKVQEWAFSIPKPLNVSCPASFAAILNKSGFVSVDLYGSGFYMAAINDEDWDDWEDWFEEYAPEFLGKEVIPVISRGSDQFVFHPKLKRKNGEPQIVWLAHDGGGSVVIPEPDLGAGGVFLRIMRERFLGKENEEEKWFI